MIVRENIQFQRGVDPRRSMKVGPYSDYMKREKIEELMTKLNNQYGVKPRLLIETGPDPDSYDYGVGFFSNKLDYHENLTADIDNWFVHLDDNIHKYDGILEEFVVSIAFNEDIIDNTAIWAYYDTLEECEKFIKSLMK